MIVTGSRGTTEPPLSAWRDFARLATPDKTFSRLDLCRALLTAQANPGPLYRCGKST